MIYRYQFVVGTAEFDAYGLDDRRARRLLARWLRLVWPKLKTSLANHHPGSIADAVNNARDCNPEALIYRASCSRAGVVQARPWPRIERFEVCADTIGEFNRVWGGW